MKMANEKKKGRAYMASGAVVEGEDLVEAASIISQKVCASTK